jgi:hypothetical protein
MGWDGMVPMGYSTPLGMGLGMEKGALHSYSTVLYILDETRRDRIRRNGIISM